MLPATGSFQGKPLSHQLKELGKKIGFVVGIALRVMPPPFQ